LPCFAKSTASLAISKAKSSIASAKYSAAALLTLSAPSFFNILTNGATEAQP